MKSSAKDWSEQELAILRALYANTMARVIGETLGRSVGSIQSKAYVLGIEGPGRGHRKGVITMNQRVMEAVRAAGPNGITSSDLHAQLGHHFPKNGKDLMTTVYRCVQRGALVADSRRRNRVIKIAPPGTVPPDRKPKAGDWSDADRAILCEQYPKLGRDRVAAILGRTRRAVGTQARLMGVQCEANIRLLNQVADDARPMTSREKRAARLQQKPGYAIAPSVVVAKKKGPFDDAIPVTYHPNFKLTTRPSPPPSLRTNTHSVF